MIDDIQILHMELMKSLNDKKNIRKNDKRISREVALDEDNSFVHLEYNIEEDVQRTVNFTNRPISFDESY